MAGQNADAVRAVYERWSEGDFNTPPAIYADDVVLKLGPQFPDPGEYRGLEGMRDYMKILLEPWNLLTIEAEEIIPVGGNVVAAVCQRGTGSGSGIPTEFRYFQVWRFEGGKVIQLENLREREDALETASA